MSEATNHRRAVARLSRSLCACAALFIIAAASPRPAGAQTPPAPVLLAQPNSTRAVALDSLSFRREPFSPAASVPGWSADNRTRLMLFALNLEGAALSDVTAEAEDGAGRRHALPVEFVGLVPGVGPRSVTQIVVRVADSLDNAGDVLVKITHRGAASNRVRVGMGFVGGGPPDDVLRLTGRVTSANNAALAGAIMTLSGAASAVTVTDAQGNYSFSNLHPAGSYTVSAAKHNYTFSPASRSVANLLSASTADFVAALMRYTIRGRITNGSAPLAGVSVGATGLEPVTTDANGNYSFSAPAEGNYLVTPSSPFFTFSPSSLAVSNLGGDQVMNFVTAARPTYSISGHVRSAGAGVAGITVTLSGAQGATVSTDAAGFYAFANLRSSDNYTVTASKGIFTFNPASRSFDALGANQTADFEVTSAGYAIRGRVTAGEGGGVPGVLITLAGSMSATTQTDAAGNYSFPVAAGGDYRVTPSSQHNSFSPATYAVDNLTDSRTANFNAVDLDGFYVLEFDGSPQTVDFGDFFWPHLVGKDATQLGHFYWEFWAMPGDNALSRYMLSDGYGGAHALLFGFTSGSGDGRYWLYGNVWDGTLARQFGGDEGPAPNEWGHFAVGWNGQFVFTYFNGVPVGITPFAGPRLPAGSDNGGGKLFIGGSDHSNFDGRIAQVRGFENANPRGVLPSVSFTPDLLFGATSPVPPTTARLNSTFLANFHRPNLTVPDLAGGRTGLLRGTGRTAPNPTQTFPLPQFVKDPQSPSYTTVRPPTPPDGMIDTPAPAPAQALIFDSFSRKNSTYAFQSPGGLGRTEGGSAGPKQWITALTVGPVATEREFFGILSGRAVTLTDWERGALAWVETGSTTGDLQVRVSRNPGFWNSGVDTGVAFRVADPSNFFFAYTRGNTLSAGDRRLTVGYWLEGRRVNLTSNVPMPASWTALQVVTTGAGVIEVYADETLVYSTESSVLATAAGAGLFTNSHDHALQNRWDNFVVYPR